MATGRSFRGVPDAGAGPDRRRRGDRAGRDRRRGPRRCCVEAAIRAVGRNRILVNKPAGTRRAGPTRPSPPGHGVRTRRPRAREGRAGRPAGLPRRPARGDRASLRGRADRLRAGAEAAQRAAAGWPPGRRGRHHARRARRPAGRGGRRAGPRPAPARRTADPGDRARRTPRWPAPHPDQRRVRGGVERRRARRPARRGAARRARVRTRRDEVDRGSRSSARTATTGVCSSTGSSAARTRRRASSARSRSRCGSPGTGWSPTSSAAHRCSSSTTSSASSTTSVRPARRAPRRRRRWSRPRARCPRASRPTACCASTPAGSKRRRERQRTPDEGGVSVSEPGIPASSERPMKAA